MVWETKKIFADENLLVNPTCVRVPVFYGHSEAVNVETEAKITADMARRLLLQSPGVNVVDDMETQTYPTPAIDSVGSDMVHVGRIREDLSLHLGLNMWIVSDNVRKGAALNSVQIAELLLKEL
jgi:aspartate-semialdehyde dehydrogenase